MPAAPVLFLSHGSPMFAVEPGQLGPTLTQLGTHRDGIKAVLVVSPHWQTRDEVAVTLSQHPDTIHDFGGFPRVLYTLQYPTQGALPYAQQAVVALAKAGYNVHGDDTRGLDHGAWVPLMHLLPTQANGQGPLPVFQVSLPMRYGTTEAYQLGQALAPLRDAGTLIIGSGGMTHNLYDMQPPGTPPAAYVQAFAQWVHDAVLAQDAERLKSYRQLAPHAVRAHPTQEHFLPLLVAMGASHPSDQLEALEGGITNGVLSMASYAWGWTR